VMAVLVHRGQDSPWLEILYILTVVNHVLILIYVL
jgi:hypothetical protein